MATTTATTAAEQPKTRARLARVAGVGPVSPIAILGGVLVAYATFTILLSATVAVLHHRGSAIDLTKGWDKVGTQGGIVVGVLLFLSYLLAGYMAGRMAWRRGIVHGIGVFVGSLVVIAAVALWVHTWVKAKDVKAVTDALRSFGIPTTKAEWRHVGSVAGLASLAGMLLGSVIGAMAGERWYTKVSRRLRVAEAAGAGEVDVRERSSARAAATDGDGNGSGSRRKAPGADLDQLTKEQLYEMAQEFDIAGRSQMTKEELKEAVQQHACSTATG